MIKNPESKVEEKQDNEKPSFWSVSNGVRVSSTLAMLIIELSFQCHLILITSILIPGQLLYVIEGTEYKDHKGKLLGTIISSGALVGVIVSILSSAISDFVKSIISSPVLKNYIARRAGVAIGILINGLGLILCAFSTTWVQLWIGFVIAAGGISISAGIWGGWLAEEKKEEANLFHKTSTTLYGSITALFGYSGHFIGAGLSLLVDTKENQSQKKSFLILYIIVLVGSTITMAFGGKDGLFVAFYECFFVQKLNSEKEHEDEENSEEQKETTIVQKSKSYFSPLKDSNIWFLLFSNFWCHVAADVATGFLFYLLRDVYRVEAPKKLVGLFLSILTACSVPAALLMGIFSKHVTIGYIFAIMGMLWLPLVSALNVPLWWLFTPSIAVYGFAAGAYASLNWGMAIKLLPSGLGISLWMGSSVLGRVLSSLIGGFLLDIYLHILSPKWAYACIEIVSVTSFALGLLLILLVRKPKGKQTK